MSKSSNDDIYENESLSRHGEIGIILAILAALFTSCGLCLQKLVHRKIMNKTTTEPAYKHTMYIAGLSYVGIGLLLKAVIYVLLPISTIAVLSAQSIIYTTVLEFFFLGGEMSKPTTIFLFLILSGIILATWGANSSDQEYTVDNVTELFSSQSSILLSVCLMGIVVGCRQVVIDSDGSFPTIGGMCYIVFSCGLFAAWFGVILKCVFELVEHFFANGSFEDASGDQHHHVATTIGIILTAGVLILFVKLRLVTFALTQYHPVQFLPLYQAATITFTTVFGVVYFQDFSSQRTAQAQVSPLLFTFGVTLVVIGVTMLTTRFNTRIHLVAEAQDSNESSLDDLESTSLLRQGHSVVTTGTSKMSSGSTSNNPSTSLQKTKVGYQQMDFDEDSMEEIANKRGSNTNSNNSNSKINNNNSSSSSGIGKLLSKVSKIPIPTTFAVSPRSPSRPLSKLLSGLNSNNSDSSTAGKFVYPDEAKNPSKTNSTNHLSGLNMYDDELEFTI